jgi:hypothetical protein
MRHVGLSEDEEDEEDEEEEEEGGEEEPTLANDTALLASTPAAPQSVSKRQVSA